MFFKIAKKCGIIPVIKIEDADKAVPLAKALLGGGVNVAEITFRTPAAADAIAKIAAEVPEMCVGAGTVVNAKQAGIAIDSGAKFIVSPGLLPEVIEAAQGARIPVLPGVVTPSEIMKGLSFGLSVFKFFPAEPFGGLKTIKTLAAPFGDVRFVPTGGIDVRNIAKYWKSDTILAVGGSFVAPEALIGSGDFAAITRRCKETAAMFQSIRKP
ncbi:MAG: bifunctional 4-hydroxy-2-oxoglutarate aldolase/2-dehydro-3-deoxy-phosphogluconate aldolase [Clostridiales Family XIII bacterium]|jgi:2-dehydro-3-deoxyphosphogluconate aldolase/(4S)-4-hydroxy-2-oxoglutarate aldolase|nr:bifunctional 4-hydroxy-2-oxoglutarate aldolase/2-dehydro-3-deoxy-phosphogluconate aldolase [Clostridiales Family XIII bacterium]